MPGIFKLLNHSLRSSAVAPDQQLAARRAADDSLAITLTDMAMLTSDTQRRDQH